MKDYLEKLKFLAVPIGLIFGAIQISVSVAAYHAWNVNMTLVKDLRENMNAYPITNIKVVSSLPCPSGMEPFTKDVKFKYKIKDKEAPVITLRKWFDRYFCVERMKSAGNAIARVRPDIHGACPTDFMKCGPYDCIPNSEPECPITGIDFRGGNTVVPGYTDTWIYRGERYYFKTTQGYARPLVDSLKALSSKVCAGESPYSKKSMVLPDKCKSRDDSRFVKLGPTRNLLDVIHDHGIRMPSGGNDVAEKIEKRFFIRNEIDWFEKTCKYQREDLMGFIPTLRKISQLEEAFMIVNVVFSGFAILFWYCVLNNEDSDDLDGICYVYDVYGLVTDIVIVGILSRLIQLVGRVDSFVDYVASSGGDCTNSQTLWMFGQFRTATQTVSTLNIVLFVFRILRLLVGLRGAVVNYEKL